MVSGRLRDVHLIIIVAGFAACDSGAEHANGGPNLVLIDDVLIAEHDSLYIGRPRALTIDSLSGHFFISDMFFERVVEVSPSGVIKRTYGRLGEGPSELRGIGGTVLSGEHLIVISNKRKEVVVFDRHSGNALKSRKFDAYLSAATADAMENVFHAQNLSRGTAVARWHTQTDTIVEIVSLPPSYKRSPALSGMYAGGVLALLNDTFTVGFAGLDQLIRATKDGAVFDTIVVPRRYRRGIPKDLEKRLSATPWPRNFSIASFLLFAAHLPDGRLLLAHYDQDIDRTRRISAKPYVSVIDLASRKACVDGVIPLLSGNSQPILAVVGELLYVLDQDVTVSGVRTSIKRFRVDQERCDWTQLASR